MTREWILLKGLFSLGRQRRKAPAHVRHARKGNGPAYVRGPVRVKVIGIDPYGLDRDKDGIGCEGRKRKKRRKK